MRAASEQPVPEEIVECIARLARRIVELTERVPQPNRARANAELNRPIEFLTENGFAIVRPWEADGSPAPAEGSFRFLVRDPHNIESEVTVDIAKPLIAEAVINTRGRIHNSSSFWICCAERHLANYVSEHDAFPGGDKLLVETLDPAEVILAMRWEKSG